MASRGAGYSPWRATRWTFTIGIHVALVPGREPSPHHVHVLLRHRLLREAGGFEGFGSRSVDPFACWRRRPERRYGPPARVPTRSRSRPFAATRMERGDPILTDIDEFPPPPPRMLEVFAHCRAVRGSLEAQRPRAVDSGRVECHSTSGSEERSQRLKVARLQASTPLRTSPRSPATSPAQYLAPAVGGRARAHSHSPAASSERGASSYRFARGAQNRSDGQAPGGAAPRRARRDVRRTPGERRGCGVAVSAAVWGRFPDS